MSPRPDLAKAVRPEDFVRIGKKTLHDAGPFNVDHIPELQAHPKEAQPAVDWYRQNIKGGPGEAKPISAKKAGAGKGITAKLLYAGPKGTGTNFMVKPYHENIEKHTTKWQRYPIQGWAEMTNQALFHAAGIGHLHQTVHVDEHPTPDPKQREYGKDPIKQQPALVIHMKPKQIPAWDMPVNEYEDDAHSRALAHRDDVNRIGIMDFLAGNQDRHGGNLLFDEESGQPLAVDHSRNFQYGATHRMKRGGLGRKEAERFAQGANELIVPSRHRDEGPKRYPGYDRFADYLGQGALAKYGSMKGQAYGPVKYERQLEIMDEMRPHIEEWWPKVRDNVVKTMEQRLGQIKDPETREHIRRNFHARVRWLNDRADHGIENFGTDWYNDPVNWYAPNLRPHLRPPEGEE